MIYCKTCGKSISPNANICPNCGEPQKKKNNISVILFTCVLFAAIFSWFYFFSQSPTTNSADEHQQKKAIVDEILGNDCNFISKAATEYIKRPLVEELLSTLINNRCDCVKKTISPILLEKYTLEDLEDLRDKPIHAVQEIGVLISSNSGLIKENCLSIK